MSLVAPFTNVARQISLFLEKEDWKEWGVESESSVVLMSWAVTPPSSDCKCRVVQSRVSWRSEGCGTYVDVSSLVNGKQQAVVCVTVRNARATKK